MLQRHGNPRTAWHIEETFSQPASWSRTARMRSTSRLHCLGTKDALKGQLNRQMPPFSILFWPNHPSKHIPVLSAACLSLEDAVPFPGFSGQASCMWRRRLSIFLPLLPHAQASYTAHMHCSSLHIQPQSIVGHFSRHHRREKRPEIVAINAVSPSRPRGKSSFFTRSGSTLSVDREYWAAISRDDASRQRALDVRSADRRHVTGSGSVA